MRKKKKSNFSAVCFSAPAYSKVCLFVSSFVNCLGTFSSCYSTNVDKIAES